MPFDGTAAQNAPQSCRKLETPRSPLAPMSFVVCSSIPLHARISQMLVDLIERGELAAGEQLPPERYLAELFGVSLAPVRQAILDTVSKGLLVRRRGQSRPVSRRRSLLWLRRPS